MEVPLELSFEEALSLPRQKLEALEVASRGSIILSCRSLNLGSTDEINFETLKNLKQIAGILKPAIIHDSLSWSCLDGHHTYLELPLPLTESNLELVVERVFRIQECLGRKIAIRNIQPYLKFVGAEFTQGEFVCEVARITGCDIVLDQFGAEMAEFDVIPKDFIKLIRSREKNNAVGLQLVATAPATDRTTMEPIPRREVKLEEGVFEAEPRKVLFEEITRCFGIRAQADLAVFEKGSILAVDGLAAYNQQYFIQIRNLLHAQYRSVAFMLSGQFDRIVVDYLLQYPPTEPLIAHAGRDFEYFLRESNTPNAEVLGDLARLEAAVCEVTEEEEMLGIDQGVMMEIESGLWDRVIFKLNDQVRLVETNHDVLKVQKSIAKGKLPESFKLQRSHYLVYKLNEKSNVQLIGRPEAKALRYAWDEMAFIKICERIASEEGLVLDQVIQQTFSFIHRWAGLGLVKAFDFKAPAEVIGLEGSAFDHEM